MTPSEKPMTSDSPKINIGWRILAVQFAALIILTVLFTIFDWDRSVAQRFYRGADGWYMGNQSLWVWLHAYGTIPGIVLTLAALVTWGAGFYFDSLAQWRRPCLVVVLTTILAAGFLVNAVLKQYWGRPRPSQTTEFGGKWDYRPIFPPGPPGKGASFPCGHCTMGFVFLSMAAFRRRSKILAYGGVTVGISLGVLLSAARVVQGAHFLNDTIWSLGIIWMVALALDRYLPEMATDSSGDRLRPVSYRRKTAIILVAAIGVVSISAGFMTRRPFYKTMIYPLDVPPAIETIHININTDPEILRVKYNDEKQGQLKVDAHGFGWMKFDYRMGFGIQVKDTTMTIKLRIEANSYFAELDHALSLNLPEQAKDKVKVLLNHQATVTTPQPRTANEIPSLFPLADRAAPSDKCDARL